MPHLFIGCNQIVGRREQYFRHVSALEVTETFEDRITDKRLAQWRSNSPRGFAFAMRAHHAVTHPLKQGQPVEGILEGQPGGSIGLLQNSEAVRLAWAETLRQVEHLAPKVITIETPVEFTPGAENRKRMEWFASELATQTKLPVAWQPRGLWDLEDTIPWVREMGMIPIFDPQEELDITHGCGTGYFAVHARRGLRANWTDFDMEELLMSLQSYQRIFLFFRGIERYRDARLAMTVWETLKEEGLF